MVKSVFELSYFAKISANFKGPSLLAGWYYGYDFWPVLRHSSVNSKKCSFATLVNIRQKLNIKSSPILNGL